MRETTGWRKQVRGLSPPEDLLEPVLDFLLEVASVTHASLCPVV